MKPLPRLVACVLLAALPSATGHAQRRSHAHPARHESQARRVDKGLSPEQVRALQVQVLLDRSHYSPGEIDASMGGNTQKAVDAFTKAGGNVNALPSDYLTTYTITSDDAAGPFTPSIPSDYQEQAKLDRLGYTNIQEMLGERFHSSPSLLRRLNPGASFAAGEEIKVPNVAETVRPVAPPGGRQDVSPENPAALTITVGRAAGTLAVTDQGGHTLFFAPVTTGSEHDPLPIGQWKVLGVQQNPKFHYNPKLFWDAQSKDTKAVLPPGPNGPVGVVWIDINYPHYGLHGTPEPALIGKTTSHGCVRLTNWDAETLAGLVHYGTRVVFTE